MDYGYFPKQTLRVRSCARHYSLYNTKIHEHDPSLILKFIFPLKLQGTICGKLRQKRSEEDARKLLRMFDEHVSNGTQINWKYWAFSRLMKPLFDSYVESVSNSVSFQEVERASSHWSEDKCQLVQIRQYAMNALKHISVQTRILEDPQSMPMEVIALAQQPFDNAPSSNGH